MLKRLLLLYLVATALSMPMMSQEPIDVSIVQLIATPKAFDGKLVRVTGFLRLQFEDTELYLHKEDSDHGLYLNGLWVDLSPTYKKGKISLDMHYVLVEGIFEAEHRGHMGMSSGTLTKIQRVEVWPESERRK
jgi:hypothetical protein